MKDKFEVGPMKPAARVSGEERVCCVALWQPSMDSWVGPSGGNGDGPTDVVSCFSSELSGRVAAVTNIDFNTAVCQQCASPLRKANSRPLLPLDTHRCFDAAFTTGQPVPSGGGSF